MWKPPYKIVDRPVLVVGGTLLGRRIACWWVSAGFDVRIQECDTRERAIAVQYIVTHLGEYMNKIRSTRRGIITGTEDLEFAASSNPWLAIEAAPSLENCEDDKEFKTRLLGDIDDQLPDDCILGVHDTTHPGLLKYVKKPHRVLIIHHYLIPDARIVEIVKLQRTENATVDFLVQVIPSIGALPIVANDWDSAGVFMKIWNTMRKDVCSWSPRVLKSNEIDAGWDCFLQMSSTGEMDEWFEMLVREHNDSLEQSYTKPESHQKPLLVHLKDMMIDQGNIAPYNGRVMYTPGFSRPGPNIFFVDCGNSDSSKPNLGRILCASIDGAIREIVTGLPLPYGLSIHVASKRAFWTDLFDGTISSCRFDGGGRAIIVPRDGDRAPRHLAVDQENSQLYWTQSKGGQIMRCNIDGTEIECVLKVEHKDTAILQSMSVSLNAITLDPSRRHIYWSRQSSTNPFKHLIQRASMDLRNGCYPFHGSDIETLFDNLPVIVDVDFIPVYDEIYWSVRATHNTDIYSAYVGPNPDYGMRKQKIILRNIEGVGWIKVDAKSGHFYATSANGFITRFDIQTGRGPLKMYENRSAAFFGIGLIDGTLEWNQDEFDSDVNAQGENGVRSKNGHTNGRIVEMNGIAEDVNSESTGTLSPVGTDETETKTLEEGDPIMETTEASPDGGTDETDTETPEDDTIMETPEASPGDGPDETITKTPEETPEENDPMMDTVEAETDEQRN